MSLTKWDPFETLEEMRQDLDRLLVRKASPFGLVKKEAELQSQWLPAVDIHEDKEGYYFDVEAPGMSADAFDIQVSNSLLTIKGERRHESEKKDRNFHRIEREYGSFMRTFTLPETAETGSVNAKYEHGVLKIKVAKKPTATPKKISVAVA